MALLSRGTVIIGVGSGLSALNKLTQRNGLWIAGLMLVNILVL